MKKPPTQDDIMQMLDKLYDMSVRGIPIVSPPIEVLANEYLQKNKDIDISAKSFIHYQIAKCTTSGFITGLGGLITLPVAIPTNISSVLYVQMRMIACLAYMGGYDVHCDQVQTLIYACLAGISVNQIAKQAGIKFSMKLSMSMVKKIPGTVLTKINQKVGFRFITKMGKTGIINLGKSVPAVGGIVGGGFDLIETNLIAKRAYRLFIEGDFSTTPNGDNENYKVIDKVDVVEV